MWSLITPELVASLVIVFVAGIVRGWSGFAFAIVSGAGLTFLMPPALFVPVVLIIELVLGLKLVPKEWRKCSWPTVNPMVASATIGTVLGVVILQGLPVMATKTLLGLAIAGSAITMLSTPKLELGPARWMPLTAGTLSGVMNGAFAMGGPPAVLFLSARLPDASRLRASIILYFFVIDAIALTYLGVTGSFDIHILAQALLFLPTSLIGVEVGARIYDHVDPQRFRPTLLIGLSIVGLGLFATGGFGWLSSLYGK